MGAVIEVGFDYSLLDTNDGAVVRDAAVRIKVRMSRTAADIIEIGRDLIAVKAKLPHGSFLRWIESEFGMSEDTAQRLMSVAKRLGGQIPHGAVFQPSVLYALAAPSTPDDVVAEAVEKSAAGETVTAADVKAMKAKWEEDRAALRRQVDEAKAVARDAKATATDHSTTLADLRSENERLRDQQHTLELEVERARNAAKSAALRNVGKAPTEHPVEAVPAKPATREAQCAEWLMVRLSVDDADHLATWLSNMDAAALSRELRAAVS